MLSGDLGVCKGDLQVFHVFQTGTIVQAHMR